MDRSKLKEYQTARILGAHCTGIESVYRLRELLGLTRQTCLVGDDRRGVCTT